MRRVYVIILFSVFIVNTNTALEISLDVYGFEIPKSKQPYIDTYVRVLGNTVSFVSNGEDLTAAIDITLTVEQGSEILAFEKYRLHSPNTNKVQDFIDMKRFALSSGSYAVHIIATDANDISNVIELKKFVEVGEVKTSPRISDIQLLSMVIAEEKDNNNLVKHGLYMEPLTYSFVGESIDNLMFFTEIYDVSSPGYIKFGIYDGYVDSDADPVMAKYEKIGISHVIPLILSLPVDKLKSGAYHVKIELFNMEKELLATSKSDFLKSSPNIDMEYWSTYDIAVQNSFVDSIADEDLKYNLLALLPVAKEPHLSLLETIIHLDNKYAQRKFLQDYWTSVSTEYPGTYYRQYMRVVSVVDEMYNSNVGYGFQTDRGHLFLKYGKPNNVLTVEDEPDAFPYEIWYYNVLNVTRQTNVRFIFYNPSLAHNDFQLLHATCVGERNNPAWEVELYRRAADSQIGTSIEATEVEEGWNRRAKEYFNDY